MIIAYIRVSSTQQIYEHMEREINDYAEQNGFKIDRWVEETISSRKPLNKRKLGQLLEELKEGDTLICSELSRLSRSVPETFTILQSCLNKKCVVRAIKENYILGDDLQSQILAFCFGVSAQIERSMISSRTKCALANVKAKGGRLGRPPSAQNKKLKLSKNTKRIKDLLDKGVSKNQIAKIMEVQYMTLCRFIKRMGWQP